MRASIWAISGAFLAFSSASLAGVAGNVSLSHYEPLEQLTVRNVSSSAANASGHDITVAPVEMRFNALGRSYDLRLEPNSRVASPAAGIDVYRGEVAGVPGS